MDSPSSNWRGAIFLLKDQVMLGQLLLDKSRWIMGWMSIEELSFLSEVSSELKDSSIVYEIGSFCGKSSRAIADNSPSGCKVYCIDPWDFEIPSYDSNGGLFEVIKIDNSTYEQFCLNLHDHIESNKVIPIKKRWEDFNPDEKADFIFIDGNHTYEAVRHDILKALQYINTGGIIAGHDYPNFDGVRMAVNEFFPNTFKVTGTIWSKKF